MNVQLTKRQKEILRLLKDYNQDKFHFFAAKKMGIKPITAQNTMYSAFRRLGINNIYQAKALLNEYSYILD